MKLGGIFVILFVPMVFNSFSRRYFYKVERRGGIDNMTRYSTEKRVVEKWLVDAKRCHFSCKFSPSPEH